MSPPSIVSLFLHFLTSVVRHGYMPSCIRDSVMSPFVEGKLKSTAQPLCIDNYHPIVLTSSLSKVLELLILPLISRAVNLNLVSNLALQLLFAQVL